MDTYKPKRKKRGKGATQDTRPSKRSASHRSRNYTPSSVMPTTHSSKGELHTIDTVPALQNINTTGSLVLVNGVQSGASFWQRNGNRIEMKSIRFRGLYDIPTNGTQDGRTESFRILLVYDRQPQNAIAISDVLQDVSPAGVASTSIMSGLNMVNSERFKILMDILNTTPDNAETPQESNQAAAIGYKNIENPIDRYINLDGAITKFKSSSNPMGFADMATGSIYCITLGTNNSPGTYSVLWQVRIRFWDSS